MSNFFFKPRKGIHYNEGLVNSIKIMVLGASHYCKYNEESDKFNCPNWADCTSLENRDSSKYNTCCPWNQKLLKEGIIKEIVKLEDSTIFEVENFLDGDSDYPAYINFTNFMLDYIGNNNPSDFWNHVLFYNYVQFFSPTEETPELTKKDKQFFTPCLMF